jgi:hypothetical protein
MLVSVMLRANTRTAGGTWPTAFTKALRATRARPLRALQS